MKLTIRFELATKSAQELHLLYREIFNALMRASYVACDRRNGLASLENIQKEINSRARGPN